MTSKSTAYDNLVSIIKDRHGGTISDREAHRLARNLMGYCELAFKVGSKKYQKNLDNQLQCNSLLAQPHDAEAELSNSSNTKK
jgi:hypothetical protein